MAKRKRQFSRLNKINAVEQIKGEGRRSKNGNNNNQRSELAAQFFTNLVIVVCRNITKLCYVVMFSRYGTAFFQSRMLLFRHRSINLSARFKNKWMELHSRNVNRNDEVVENWIYGKCEIATLAKNYDVATQELHRLCADVI